jgi:predicted dithiol-disulfide oxidoreductase (DUF899 family)
VVVSRATLPEIEAYKTLMDWDLPCVSSFGSSFNYDMDACLLATFELDEHEPAAAAPGRAA